MIIFGTRGVTMTPEKGEFFCPSCSDHRGFKRRSVRRFFTLYFIPVIPLDKLGEYIECGTCKDTFREQVLDFDPSAQAAKFDAEFQIAVRRVMALMALADGDVDDNEIASMVETNDQITGKPLSSEEMQAEIESVRTSGKTLNDVLKDVAPFLNNGGKEMVVRAAWTVAKADGNIDEDEKNLVKEIGKGLELSSAHLNGILAELDQA